MSDYRCGHRHRGRDGMIYQCIRKPGHWRRHLNIMGWRWRRNG